jgi:hypothetical protein
VREVTLPGLPRLPPRLLELFVQFLDREVKLVGLPDLARQSFFEAGDASRELFDLVQMRRIRRGDETVHALVLHLDHLVELADRGRDRVHPLVVDGPDLPDG